MKKILAFLLAVSMILAMAACAAAPAQTTTETAQTEQTEQTPATEPAAEEPAAEEPRKIRASMLLLSFISTRSMAARPPWLSLKTRS